MVVVDNMDEAIDTKPVLGVDIEEQAVDELPVQVNREMRRKKKVVPSFRC
jgi:hypothetical protein